MTFRSKLISPKIFAFPLVQFSPFFEHCVVLQHIMYKGSQGSQVKCSVLK